MKPVHQSLTTLKSRQQLLYIMVFSLVAVMFWIGGSLFRSQKSTQISSELRTLAEPLIPTIDRTVINQLLAKKKYEDIELRRFPIFAIRIDDKGNKVQTNVTQTQSSAEQNPQPSSSPELTTGASEPTTLDQNAPASGTENTETPQGGKAQTEQIQTTPIATPTP